MASASSSASTTPMPLTPDSTGGAAVIALSSSNSSNGAISSSPTGESSTTVKKARRQATMYDHTGAPKPVKPFSRSAAKRESVLALGSIEHLQQYFTKTGMVNKKNPLFDKKHYGLVPAIGGMPLSPVDNDNMDSQIPSIHESLAHANPPPAASRAPIPIVSGPHVKTSEVHPDTLLPGVISELSKLSEAWNIDAEPGSQPVDVLPLLRSTTRTIQTVRNYVLSLPDDSISASVREQFTSNPRTASASTGQITVDDPLSLIRRCSLNVLACLRELEETARIPLSDDAYDAQSDGGGSRGAPSRGTSPIPASDEAAQYYGDLGITFSLVQVHGRYEQVAVWDTEEDDFDDDEPKEKREIWQEQLEVANGWLYRKDIRMEDLQKERGIVRDYLDAVDRALFPARDGEVRQERGWEVERKKLETRTSRFTSGARSRSKPRRISSGEDLARGVQGLTLDTGGNRRVSTGMLNLRPPQPRFTAEPEDMEGIQEEGSEGEEAEGEGLDEELDDDELPDWAKRTAFTDDDLGRAYTFLSKFLPQPYQYALIPPSPSLVPPDTQYPIEPSKTAFLTSLSSGQLLCHAYNACVRKSNHPWGFVSKEGVHDILALEKAAAKEGNSAASSKTGWTFRRTDNLRLWVSALKLRYMLPIQMPAQVVTGVPVSIFKLPSAASSSGLSSSRSQRGGSAAVSGPRSMGTNASVSHSKSTSTASTGATATSSSNSKDDRGQTAQGEGKSAPDTLLFDAAVVARKDGEWEEMLEKVVLKWMWKAVSEKRKALPTPIG